MLSQFRKNRFKRVLSKEYASFCSEPYRGTEDTAKPSKNLFGDNLFEKNFQISEENKLFKEASKFASDNCQSHGSKGFQTFRKGSQLFSQPIPQKAKAGSDPPSRRVVFRSKSKRGASIQKRNSPLNRENQILSGKLVQINFRQDCFTNDKRASNSFPILSKTTENNPCNSPSFEGRIRNIKSRNSILKRQRCHHGNSFNSSKVYKPTLYSPKTLRGETTCDKPCSSEQSHLQSTIQDGRFRKSQILTKPRGLFREDRSFG